MSAGHSAQPCSDCEQETDSDDALVAAARADPRAFAPLYRRYATPLYRYCYLRLGEQAAAEDATSEAFIKALANLHGFRDGHFAAWLFRIAHNVVSDAHRRRTAAPLVDIDNRPDTDPTPEAQAMTRDRLEALRRALAALPESQRHAAELHLAGWSVAESARALGISPGALKVLRLRALRRLRGLLAGTEWDETTEVSHDLE